jgi:hypothetical protein
MSNDVVKFDACRISPFRRTGIAFVFINLDMAHALQLTAVGMQ